MVSHIPNKYHDSCGAVASENALEPLYQSIHDRGVPAREYWTDYCLGPFITMIDLKWLNAVHSKFPAHHVLHWVHCFKLTTSQTLYSYFLLGLRFYFHFFSTFWAHTWTWNMKRIIISTPRESLHFLALFQNNVFQSDNSLPIHLSSSLLYKPSGINQALLTSPHRKYQFHMTNWPHSFVPDALNTMLQLDRYSNAARPAIFKKMYW